MMLNTLGYHDVVHREADESGFTNVEARQYKLDWPSFREHLDLIAGRVDAPPITAAELSESEGGWAITFDDGGSCAVEVASELAQRGWKGHFFVTTGRIRTPGFLDEDGIREVAALGHVIGTHTVTHKNLASVASWDELLAEWRESSRRLEEIVGAPVTVGSVPGGWFSRRVAEAAAAAGLDVLFTSEPIRRVTEIDGCLVVGRRSIRRGDPGSTAAAAAAGSQFSWGRQRAAWQARKFVKRLARRQYEALRRAWIGRR